MLTVGIINKTIWLLLLHCFMARGHCHFVFCGGSVMANLVLPKFGPRTIYCRKILVLGPFLSCKNGPTVHILVLFLAAKIGFRNFHV